MRVTVWCLLVCLLVGGVAAAATLNVPADYGTIQAAIDAAANGDTIIVQPGTYSEVLNFGGKAITVKSTNPADPAVVEATIIDGDGSSPVISFITGEANSTILEGFTITGGDAYDAPDSTGGGILCEAASPTIRYNLITRNGEEIEGYGGGIACTDGAAPRIINNILSYNNGEYGGAICIVGEPPFSRPPAPAVPVIRGNIFFGNVGYYGGAVYCEYASFSAQDNQFGLGQTTNPAIAAAQARMAARMDKATPQSVSRAVFTRPAVTKPTLSKERPGSQPRQVRKPAPRPRSVTRLPLSPETKAKLDQAREATMYAGNAGAYGGAVHLYYASAKLTGNTFVNNGSSYEGAGVYVGYTGTLTCENNLFERNLTYYDYGGGVYAYGYEDEQPVISFSGDRFINNVASDGSGVACEDIASATFTNCTFDGNVGDSAGMGIYVEAVIDYPTTVTVTDCALRNCTGEGGVIDLYGDSEDYGGITATITGCTFDHNKCTDYPGAVWLEYGATATISNCTFTDNATDYYGGGLCVEYGSSATVSGCTFTDNVASTHGGAVYVYDDCSATFDQCTFTHNVSLSDSGGAAYLYGSDAAFSNCSFTNNSADYYGGAIYAYDGLLQVHNTTFTGNACGYGGSGSAAGGAIYLETMGGNPGSSNARQGRALDISCLEDCTFTRNAASWYGGALYGYDGYLEVRRCSFIQNATYYEGGAVDWQASQGAIFEDNLFEGNSTTWYGGALYLNGGDENTNIWRNNVFHGNMANATDTTGIAGACGGAIYANDDLDFTNSILWNNSATGFGGGMYASWNYTQNVLNNTFVGNAALQGGGLYISGNGGMTFKNNIVAYSRNGGGLYSVTTDFSGFAFNNAFGNKGGEWASGPDMTGTDNNISEGPYFADRANGDFHLKSRGGRWDPASSTWVIDTITSRCIDAGDPADDFANEPEENGDRINLGAYGNTAQASKSSMFHRVILPEGADGVRRAGPITFVFLQPVGPGSVRERFNLGLPPGARGGGGTVEWLGQTHMTYTPNPAFAAQTAYLATFGSGIALQEGGRLNYFENVPFTTGKEPVIVARTPAPDATDVAVDSNVVIEFDQPMNKVSVEKAFSLTPQVKIPDPVTPLAGVFSWNTEGTIMTFDPSSELNPATVLIVALKKTAMSAAKIQLGRVASWSFETIAGPIAPSALAVSAAAAPAGNGSVQITVQLSAAATVNASIRNLAGVEVAVLPAQDCASGLSTLVWNGRAKSGVVVPGGRYLVTLVAASADGKQATCLAPLQK